MATDQRTDPYRGYNFVIEIDGVPKGAFSEVGGWPGGHFSAL